MTREARFALAHALNERAWADPRNARRHAHAVACAYARELARADRGDSKTLQAWREIAFTDPGVFLDVWPLEAF